MAVGPIRQQATDVVAMLSDPTRCQVLLVTAPEETPVREAAETALILRDLQKAGKIDRGSDTATMIVVRRLRRNRNTTITASAAIGNRSWRCLGERAIVIVRSSLAASSARP